jgi:cytoskeletal protein CcmA (bactofilin family)
MFDTPDGAPVLTFGDLVEVETYRYRRFVMALWNDQSEREKSVPAPAAKAPEKQAILSAVGDAPPRPAAVAAPQARTDASMKESVISAGLVIEGKIEGAGHVRIAGTFKGDVNVQGNLTIEPGAHLTGGVKADTVIVGGQLDGNIDAASRVELLQTGVLNGELKAGSLTVAAGSRMRGKAEFGWDEKPKH